jgi:phytoene dehydrogenase-like protein
VVVGGGPNGLVAANVLADRGWSVLVLEQQERAGGAAVSDRAMDPAFVTDLYSAFYPLAAVSPALRRLDLARHGLRWTHAPEVLAHVLPDDRAVLLSRDLARTAASVEAFGAGDGQCWVELARWWRRAGGPLVDSLLGPFPPVSGTVRLARRLGADGLLRLARLATLSVRRLGDEQFAGEGAKLLLTGNGLHADLPATSPGSGLMGLLLAMVGQHHGFPVPVAGAGRITDALVDRLRSRSGKVRCGTDVDRVLVRGGRAVGVVDASGREYPARRAVLADVTAPQLYRRLLRGQAEADGVRRALDRYSPDLATLKINWALDAPLGWTAGEARAAGTVHLGGGTDDLADQAHDLALGRVPERPFVVVGQMTTADASRSPAGTESLWAYLHLPAASVRQPQQAQQVVARQVQLVEDMLEQHAPGFASRVRARQVQGPHDLQAGDASLVLGGLNGGSAQLWQQVVFRPTPGLGRAETVVDRLLLAGAAAHPGGGVHGVPGDNAARAALLRDSWGRSAVGRGLVATQRALSVG